MKHRIRRSSWAAATMVGLAATGWSGASRACAVEPYISSVCLMAWNRTASFGNTYMPAAGQLLQVNQNQALFALLGNTYGGNGSTNFQLPDLRGRVAIGVGQGNGLPAYVAGQVGGSPTTTLTVGQLPVHNHLLVTGTGGVTVNAGVGTLTAATSLTGVTATASASGLTLNANSGSAGSGTPGGASLAGTGLTKVYATAAPNVAMAAGSIGGSAPVTFGGTAPSTTLSGAPSVSISGQTAPAGSGASFSTMPPYLALNYYIAYSGIFPTSD